VLRAELTTVAEELLKLPGEALTLDQVAEALNHLRVSFDEVDELFSWLEAHGRVVGEREGPGASVLLGAVLSVARSLRAELGRAPQPREIAERGSLTVEAVQRALWFARILQR
jgi:hypothetical protein